MSKKIEALTMPKWGIEMEEGKLTEWMIEEGSSFSKGDPLLVQVSKDGKNSYTEMLGDNIDNKENMHVIINAGSWFSMVSSGEYSLIGCTVAPGFNYSDFELAPKNWEPG